MPPLRLLPLAAAVMISGCTVSDRDVSRDPHFLMGYRPGEVYQLTQPVTLLRIEKGYYELLPPGETREYGNPAGTLPAGARIEILALRHAVTAAPVQWESAVTVSARLADRPDDTVALNSISTVHWVAGDAGTRSGVLAPDPQWITIVEPTKATQP